jgi:hypothetical protein
MQEQAASLVQAVSVFKLDNTAAVRPLAQVQAKLQPALPPRRAVPALKGPARAAAQAKSPPKLAVAHATSGDWTEF